MSADIQSASAPNVVDLFKDCFGGTHDLQPEDYKLEKDIPWSTDKMVGDKYIESVILGAEVGITLGGTGNTAFEIGPAVAGAVKQTEVQPYQMVLPSVIPWATVSRSAGAGKKAFFEATKHTVKNNLKSHGRFLEIFRLYGQSTYKLGRVSYATATYRGVSFTNGAATLEYKGTAKVFATGGVNVADKLILLAPGDFAAGIWVGMRGLRVQQIVTSSGAVLGEGSLVGVDAMNGIIEVDFVPTAASGTTSHHLCIKGQADVNECVGIQKILTTRGTLFNINNLRYELFQGNHYPVTGKLTLPKVNLAVAIAVNQGMLEEDVDLYVNPRSWATMGGDEAALRAYDSSYDKSKAEAGFTDLVYYSQNGKLTVKAHRMVKEGDAFALCLPYWTRSGSAQQSFKVPGSNVDLIFPLENQAGYAFRSFSDQYVFTAGPCKSIYFSGINDESTT